MENNDRKKGYVVVGDMTVKAAILESIDSQSILAKAKGFTPEQIQIWETVALLEWYQKMALPVLQSIAAMNDLRESDPEKQRKMVELADRLFDTESQIGRKGTNEAGILTIQRQYVRETLRPIRDRLFEMQAVCEEIAEERQIGFSPSLPAPYDILLARIVDSGSSN